MAEMSFADTAGSIKATHTLPSCGIAAGAQILTLRGTVAVETIVPGDRLITRNGARTVIAVEVATLASAQVVLISQDVMGNARPEADLTVAPGQPILIRDWRAKAMTGVDQAVMAAERLADGDYIRVQQVTDLHMHTVRFADDQVIYVAGLELVCNAMG